MALPRKPYRKPHKPHKHHKPRPKPWSRTGWRKVGSGVQQHPRSSRMQWLSIIVPSAAIIVAALITVWFST